MIDKRKISVTGLGYVGLPIAIALAKHFLVVGFDQSTARIQELKSQYDHTNEVDTLALKNSSIVFTDDPDDIHQADFHIIAVPTPIDKAKKPDLGIVLKASETVGKQLKPGDIVVYESTVYPGATEEDCIPVLEASSSLKCGKDFNVGYSPERINPGDTEHRFDTIVKVVSAQNEDTLKIIAQIYETVVTAGVHKASSIKVAEAAKVIENTQRDLNIALINELSQMFNLMGINTHEVLEAAKTKWNFLNFKPGLVGGHCIGVDPYYLTHKAAELNYFPKVILAGRQINDQMGKFIAEQTVKQMIKQGLNLANEKVAILGITFKENCPDIRNTKVIDIINELKNYGIEAIVHDPIADPKAIKEEYNITLTNWDKITNVGAMILAVAHDHYRDLSFEQFEKKLKDKGAIIDIKSILDKKMNTKNISIWSL